jgi:hypothetical protein
MDPITTNDSRSRTWKREGKTHKCELEALAPNVVADLLTEAIESRIDTDALEEVKRQERADRSGLWYGRGVPDFEIPASTDFKNGHRQLGDFARRVIHIGETTS